MEPAARDGVRLLQPRVERRLLAEERRRRPGCPCAAAAPRRLEDLDERRELADLVLVVGEGARLLEQRGARVAAPSSTRAALQYASAALSRRPSASWNLAACSYSCAAFAASLRSRARKPALSRCFAAM